MSRVLVDGRWQYECDAWACAATIETGEGRKGEAARIAARKGWLVTGGATGRAKCPLHKGMS